jgi:hypothetical protein
LFAACLCLFLIVCVGLCTRTGGVLLCTGWIRGVVEVVELELGCVTGFLPLVGCVPPFAFALHST